MAGDDEVANQRKKAANTTKNLSREERKAQERSTLWYMVGQGALNDADGQDGRMLRGILREQTLETLSQWHAESVATADELEKIYNELAFGRAPDAQRLGK